MIRNLYMHKQLSRLNPLRCSDGNKRFSMCLSSTCIGANDSHTVLTKNSFGATTKESPKASLDDYLKWIGWSHQVARCRFEYQAGTKCTAHDYRNTSNVHSHIMTNVKSRKTLAEQ